MEKEEEAEKWESSPLQEHWFFFFFCLLVTRPNPSIPIVFRGYQLGR